MGSVKATVYVADNRVLCICVCQSGERVGRWNPWSLPQCCPLRPPQVGRGTATHQKLEVCSFTKHTAIFEFEIFPTVVSQHAFLSQTTALSPTKTGRGRPRQVSSLADIRQPAEGGERPDYCRNGCLWQLPAELWRSSRCRAGLNIPSVFGLFILQPVVSSV